MTGKLLDDCFLHDQDRLRHAEALALLQERIVPIAGTEEIALAEAGGRVIAEAVTAPRPVPQNDNAAVDGYAFAHADYLSHGGRLPVVGRIAAGHPSAEPLKAGAAARIFTGAVMPERADTVVMQEDVEVSGDGAGIAVPDGLKKGANRRLAGEDLAAGAVLIEPGRRLRPQDLAAIASTGQGQVTCYTKLRVGLFSTGDEIARPGEPLKDGGVYDSNHYMLRALAAEAGVETDDLGILPDDPLAVRQALTEAGGTYDALITSGGASRGEEDHVVTTLNELGTLAMWQLAIKPGRPMSFGRIGGSVFVGLPGNPVAVMVCFLLYVRPMLLRLGGAAWPQPRRYRLPAGFAMNKKPDRREFLRGIIAEEGRNGLTVDKFERDGSGLITSLRQADGLIEIGEETTAIEPGDPVDFLPFSELGIAPS